ncbi:MAG: carbohydrate binding domain-containing protein [Planctomycetota bacterium]
MKRPLAYLIVVTLSTPAVAEVNLVRNGSFEVADDGVPDGWQASGDQHVTQDLAIDRGRDGNRCARLRCTRFTAVSPSSHVMLCQMGVPVERGKSYRVTFRARGEAIAGDGPATSSAGTNPSRSDCGCSTPTSPPPRKSPCDWL